MNRVVVEALRATRTHVSECFATSSFAAAAAAAATPPPSPPTNVYARPPQLVAVSKTKPIELLISCYEEGQQRHFGENYVQEIIEKVPLMPMDTKWHFIGPIQTNKINNLINKTWPALSVIETVGTFKLANKLEIAVARVMNDISLAPNAARVEGPPREEPLDVLVQVNTSGESQKSGVEPGDEVIALAEHIQNEVRERKWWLCLITSFLFLFLIFL